MNKQRKTELVLASLMTMALSAPKLLAQAAPAPSTEPAPSAASVTPATSAASTDEDVLELSPFVVDAGEDKNNYRATSTVGGSRVRTDLRDLPSSISVVTSQFLKDVNATDSQSLLTYTTNTEVGGMSGNYAGVGNTMVNGVGDSLTTLVRPSNNTRVRGLDSADNTRDYYSTDIPWDGYNIDRVELQRGPNSILFGIGSPAGIINTSLVQAGTKNGGKVEFNIGSNNTTRSILDYNQVLIKKELSVRFLAVDNNQQYRQRPAYEHGKRAYATARYTPEFLNKGSAHTTVRVNFESGKIDANRPRTLPLFDYASGFFTPSFNKMTVNPYDAWLAGLTNDSNKGKSFYEPWLNTNNGLQATNNPTYLFNSYSGTPISGVYEPTTSGTGALGRKLVDGVPTVYVDDGIGGIPFGHPMSVNGYFQYAKNTNQPGADHGYYKDKTLDDPTVFDFYNKLIDGPNKHEWQHWNAFNVNVDQTFLNDRLSFQLAYDHQSYADGYVRNLGWAPALMVDVNQTYLDLPTTWYPESNNTGQQNNPNVGRLYVGSSTQNQGAFSSSVRDNARILANAELRGSDLFGKGALATILGTHRFTALASRETRKYETRNFSPYATDRGYTDTLLQTGSYRISDGGRNPDIQVYLSDDIRSRSSLHGLNLEGITALQRITPGATNIKYFSTAWNGGNVDPLGTWTNPIPSYDSNGQPVLPVTQDGSYQTENPANYVGWTSKSFTMLAYDHGQDINQLYADINRGKTTTDSVALTWQGNLLDGTVVPTFGWRRDRFTSKTYDAKVSTSTGAASMTDFNTNDPTGSKGETKTWGVVIHTPNFIRKHLPGNTDVSFIFNDGNNSRVENRFGFDGAALPNAKGHSKDYGVAISTLDDRLTLKATWYDTKVTDANLGGGEQGTLGSNTYFLYLSEAWGTANAAIDLLGMGNQLPGYEGNWNWALVDNGWDWSWADPTTDKFNSNASTIAEKAAANKWMATLPSQAFFDRYGLVVDVAALQSGDLTRIRNAFGSEWAKSPGIGGVQAAGKGRIQGVYPTGTINTRSKGFEFELTGQPLKNWNVSVNASKTFASREELGTNIVNFIESRRARYQTEAGDLRLWWAGDTGTGTMRSRYDQSIWAPYQFQVSSKGQLVPEMVPWRFNIVNSYNFDSGFLKGVNVGFGYRWEKGHILGYGLKNVVTDGLPDVILDVSKPYWGEKQDALDLWVGYGRRVNSKIDWRIQLNVRNVGDHARLIPISVEPDGSLAQSRIAEGMTWNLSNTFSF